MDLDEHNTTQPQRTFAYFWEKFRIGCGFLADAALAFGIEHAFLWLGDANASCPFLVVIVDEDVLDVVTTVSLCFSNHGNSLRH